MWSTVFYPGLSELLYWAFGTVLREIEFKRSKYLLLISTWNPILDFRWNRSGENLSCKIKETRWALREKERRKENFGLIMGSSLGRGHCVVFLGMKLLLSQCLSPPRCINGYLRIFREEYQIAGECSAMDQHPIDPGGVELLLAASPTETR